MARLVPRNRGLVSNVGLTRKKKLWCTSGKSPAFLGRLGVSVLGWAMRENEELWKKLCAQAAVEQDPKKLMELTREITRLLREKEERLAAQRKQSSARAAD